VNRIRKKIKKKNQETGRKSNRGGRASRGITALECKTTDKACSPGKKKKQKKKMKKEYESSPPGEKVWQNFCTGIRKDVKSKEVTIVRKSF